MMLKALLISGLSWLAHEPAQQPVVVELVANPGTLAYKPLAQTGQSPVEAYVYVVGEDGQQPNFTMTLPEADVPPVWIGVRMVPVPDALAAHIGREGMMIGNVVEGSPADKAGVERYDVVVSFNGEAIEDGGQLVEVINDLGAGKKADLIVIRGGERTKLKLRPGKRPKGLSHEYKYDDPALAQNNTTYFGHNMTLAPDGQWQMQPLGKMHDLSDLLEDFDLDDLDNMKTFTFNGNGQFGISPRIKMRSLPGMQFDMQFDMDDILNGSDIDGDVEVVIRSSDGASTLEIQRNADGSFTVTREDEDGESIDEYESLDALEDHDGEAFQMFEGHGFGGVGGQSMIFMQPRTKDLPRMQKDFSTQIEKRIREAHERAAQSRTRVEKRQRRSAGDGEEKRIKRRVMRKRDHEDHDGEQEEHQIRMQVQVSDDGVRVEMTENGVRKIYEFDDVDHFRRSEPELFERCEPLIED